MKVEQSRMKEVFVYADGACETNPGPGGYGVVLIYGKNRKELSGGYRLTTNNRMELMAAIKALETLKTRCKVTLYSDSLYLVQAMTRGWAKRWRERSWKRSDGLPAANADLWEKLLELSQMHQVSFVWVKGHSGHPENEYCDRLAAQARLSRDLPADVGYETPYSTQPGLPGL
jgi:ribonuclease HI